MSDRELNADLRAARTLQAPEQVVFDHADRSWKPSTSAFKPQSDGSISVDLEEILLEDDLPLTHRYPRVARGVGLVAHLVGRLSAASLQTQHAPIEGNRYHGEARGKPSRSERHALAATCEIIVAVDGDEAQRHLDEKLARQAKLAQESDLRDVGGR